MLGEVQQLKEHVSHCQPSLSQTYVTSEHWFLFTPPASSVVQTENVERACHREEEGHPRVTGVRQDFTYGSGKVAGVAAGRQMPRGDQWVGKLRGGNVFGKCLRQRLGLSVFIE